MKLQNILNKYSVHVPCDAPIPILFIDYDPAVDLAVMSLDFSNERAAVRRDEWPDLRVSIYFFF